MSEGGQFLRAFGVQGVKRPVQAMGDHPTDQSPRFRSGGGVNRASREREEDPDLTFVDESQPLVQSPDTEECRQVLKLKELLAIRALLSQIQY